MTTIPVIDFQTYSLDKEGPGDLRKLGSEMCSALEDIGFCYIKNHGVSEQLVSMNFLMF